jgi:thioredoxin reductase
VVVADVQSAQESTITCNAAFVAVGHVPNTQLFTESLQMDAEGYLILKPGSTATSVEGVYAAGAAPPTTRSHHSLAPLTSLTSRRGALCGVRGAADELGDLMYM